MPEAFWLSAAVADAESLKALGRGRVIGVPGLNNGLLVALARTGRADLLLKARERRLPPNAAEETEDARACRNTLLSKS